MTSSPLSVLTCPASSGAAPNNLLTFGRPNQEGKTKNADLTLKLHLQTQELSLFIFYFLLLVLAGIVSL